MAATLQNSGLGTQPEQQSFGRKFQEKLAESRFFAVSLIIHVLLVFFAGTIVLYKAYIEPPDFVAEGGDGLIAQTEDLPPPETPQDSVPQEQFTPQTPNINSPNIDVISTTAQTTAFKVAPAQVRVNISTDASDIAKATNAMAKGAVGGLGNLPAAMRGRVGSGKKTAMDQNKMKTASEQAVMKGLNWLQQNQNADGSWGDKYKGAMTGLALLCFLGHGETPESAQYGLTVNRAVQWFLDNGTKFQGRLNMAKQINSHDVYEHAIGAYALGEFFTMTKDERVVELLKQAVDYIVKGQGPKGGWMYSYTNVGNDVSVSGWQIQALKAAHLTQLNLPGVDEALEKSMHYLESMKGPQGGYGYQNTPSDRYSLTGVGILCRLFWKGEKGDLRKGME